MADLEKLISDKTIADAQRREQQQADQGFAVSIRDESVDRIASGADSPAGRCPADLDRVRTGLWRCSAPDGGGEAGLLYEDSLHHNCVFVGRDSSGKPVFASKRGTCDLNGPGFKGDSAGRAKAGFSDRSAGLGRGAGESLARHPLNSSR